MEDAQDGGCLCGAVRYRVAGRAHDLIHCHCRFCQRLTGAAGLTELLYERAALSVIEGRAAVAEHVSEGSGKTIFLHHCADCATRMWMTFERFPKVVGVMAGTLDDPDAARWRAGQTMVFYLSQAPFDTVIPGGVDIHHGHYWLADGIASEPVVFDEPTPVTDELREWSRRELARQRRDAGVRNGG